MSLRCEPLAPQDIPSACDLFDKVFGHKIKADHWHWKYHEGPRLASYNLIARNPQGHIVGHVGASVFPGFSNGQSLPMAQVSDVMVHANARSAYGHDQGLYPLLMRTLQQEINNRFPELFAYGFVGIRPYKLGHRMGLYRKFQECRTGRMSSPVGASELRNGFIKAYPVSWQQGLDSGLFEKSTALAKRQSDSTMVERSSAYMRWRYQQHPVNDYQLWVVRQWWRDAGWLVTRQLSTGQHMLIDQWPMPVGMNKPLGQIQLDAVMRELTKQNPQALLDSWCFDTPQARQTEPVIATEFRIQSFREHFRTPIFTPGDTDVY